MKEHDYTEEVFNSGKKFKDLVIFFDGCCEPTNPNGNMGYGWCLREEKEIIAHGHGYQLYNGKEFTSNNISEWTACCLALQFILKNELKYRSLKVFGDSKLVINQASGIWKINVGMGYSTMAFMFLDKFKPHFPSAKYGWIPRDKNGYCDELSKRYIKITGTKLNETDFGRKIENKLQMKNGKQKKNTNYSHQWDIKKANFDVDITCVKCGCKREYVKERFSDGYHIYTIDGEERLDKPNCIR